MMEVNDFCYSWWYHTLSWFFYPSFPQEEKKQKSLSGQRFRMIGRGGTLAFIGWQTSNFSCANFFCLLAILRASRTSQSAEIFGRRLHPASRHPTSFGGHFAIRKIIVCRHRKILNKKSLLYNRNKKLYAPGNHAQALPEAEIFIGLSAVMTAVKINFLFLQ